MLKITVNLHIKADIYRGHELRNQNSLDLLAYKRSLYYKSKSKVKVCFIVNSATCTVHTYRE